jgi:alanyl-tRNA synthetase
VAEAVIEKLGHVYPEIKRNEAFVFEELKLEEAQFQKAVHAGERMFEKVAEKCTDQIAGDIAFDLYQTYGFPIEMTMELAEEKGLKVDEAGFHKAFEEHQKKSRDGATKKFQGGLSGEDMEAEAKLHTATHLLHAALRHFLGDHVEQRGSNITHERLRFDFNHPEKVERDMLDKIETWVNEAIEADVPIDFEEMTVDEAKKVGAIGLFEDKYGAKVKVYSMGHFSKEICGGPHAERTGILKSFKIKKEQSASRGVRRIKAVIGK